MIFNQQVAVITGAASGIGFALAKSCLQEQFIVVMADVDQEKLAAAVTELQKEEKNIILAVDCDVTKPESLKYLAHETLRHFKRIDWLFNNAGISGPLAPIWTLPDEEIQRVIDVNLFGVIHGIKTFLPIMFAQNHRSHLINIASVFGLCSASHMAAYSMSKHAIVALSESLYFDLQQLKKPVDVSVVCPSFANTGLLDHNTKNSFQEILAEYLARSRPAADIAQHVIDEVKKKTFYILPDKEVKGYCEQRTQAIIEQTNPHRHSLEKILSILSQRVLVDEKS